MANSGLTVAQKRALLWGSKKAEASVLRLSAASGANEAPPPSSSGQEGEATHLAEGGSPLQGEGEEELAGGIKVVQPKAQAQAIVASATFGLNRCDETAGRFLSS